MSWSLPLAALAAISNFDNSNIPSHDHYQHTSDTYDSIWPWRSYKTSPHMPPHMEITRYDKSLYDGYIFLTPADQKTRRGTYELSGTGYIMTEDGDLVFAGEESGYNFCSEWVAGMTDFRVQEYKGRPHLVYWNGCNTQGAHWGHRWGRVTFIDEEYTNFTVSPDLNINTLDPVNRGQIDVHEHQMTDRNSMVVTTYNNTQMDLTSQGGDADGWLAESMFTEFDIETGEVLFEWRAADHIALEDSRWPRRSSMGTKHLPWDWFHINSVQRVGEDYLISSRHHWAVFLINGTDGSVIWKLDGINGGSFGSIPTEFKWQHHARAQNVTKDGMTISLFNNHVNGNQGKDTQSQALAFWLPLPASKKNPPVLVRKLMTDDNRVFAATQGSYQVDLGNGNGFVGYGKIPLAREYGPAGDGSDLRWQARFGKNDAAMSYRTFKAKWHGTPKNWDPVATFEKVRLQKQRAPKVYVSWNGATDISSWAVYAGDDRENLKSVGVTKKKGFETVFDLEGANCVQLGAIRGGEIIRASNVACIEEVDPDLDTDLGDDYQYGGAVVQPELERLQAEKEALEAELAELAHQLDDAESGTWFEYKLFGVFAIGVVLLVLGPALFIQWRNWRRDRQPHLDSYPQSGGFPSTLGRSLFRWSGASKLSSGGAGFVGFTDEERTRNGGHPEDFERSEDDDEENAARTTARTPFMRQTTER
jgi:hypothetical protein